MGRNAALIDQSSFDRVARAFYRVLPRDSEIARRAWLEAVREVAYELGRDNGSLDKRRFLRMAGANEVDPSEVPPEE